METILKKLYDADLDRINFFMIKTRNTVVSMKRQLKLWNH
jgi:hypothetical protein